MRASSLRLAARVVAVVERVILRQMPAGLGQLLHCRHQGTMLGREFERFNPHLHPFRWLRPGGQDDRPTDHFPNHPPDGFPLSIRLKRDPPHEVREAGPRSLQ